MDAIRPQQWLFEPADCVGSFVPVRMWQAALPVYRAMLARRAQPGHDEADVWRSDTRMMQRWVEQAHRTRWRLARRDDEGCGRGELGGRGASGGTGRPNVVGCERVRAQARQPALPPQRAPRWTSTSASSTCLLLTYWWRPVTAMRRRLQAALTRAQPTRRSCEARLALTEQLHRALVWAGLNEEQPGSLPRHWRGQLALVRSMLRRQLSEQPGEAAATAGCFAGKGASR